MTGREVAESNGNLRRERGKRRREWYTSIQRLVLEYLDDGRITLWELSAQSGKPRDELAWALGHLIARGYVVAVREDHSLKFEKIPGGLVNFILDHEV